MGQGYQVNFKGADFNIPAKLDKVERNIVQNTSLRQTVFDEIHGERRRPNGTADTVPETCQRAHMIFMGMGENNAENVAPVLFDKFDIRHDNINTGRVRIAECNAHIDDYPFAVMGRSKPK